MDKKYIFLKRSDINYCADGIVSFTLNGVKFDAKPGFDDYEVERIGSEDYYLFKFRPSSGQSTLLKDLRNWLEGKRGSSMYDVAHRFFAAYGMVGDYGEPLAESDVVRMLENARYLYLSKKEDVLGASLCFTREFRKAVDAYNNDRYICIRVNDNWFNAGSSKLVGKIRMAVKDSELKLADIEQRCGIKMANISQICNGKNSPTIKTLEKLLDAIGYEIRIVPKDAV